METPEMEGAAAGMSRRKLEAEVQKLNNLIKEKEAQHAGVSAWQITDEMHAKLRKIRMEKDAHLQQAKSISSHLTVLRNELGKKENEMGKMQPQLHYKEEYKINEAIQRLENQLRRHNFKLNDERKIVQEIDSLKRSKRTLIEYDAVRQEKESMRKDSVTHRNERDELYNKVKNLRAEEKDLTEKLKNQKWRQEDLKADIDNLCEQRRSQQAALNDLKHQQKLEMQRRKDAERRAFLENKRKEREKDREEEMKIPVDPYLSHKQTCVALIAHLQRYVTSDGNSANSNKSHDEGTAPTAAAAAEGMTVLRKKQSLDDDLYTGMKTKGKKGKKEKRVSRSATQVLSLKSCHVFDSW